MPKATVGLRGGKQSSSFPGKQTEALQGRVTFSRLQNWEVVGSLGLLSLKAWPPSCLLKKKTHIHTHTQTPVHMAVSGASVTDSSGQHGANESSKLSTHQDSGFPPGKWEVVLEVSACCRDTPVASGARGVKETCTGLGEGSRFATSPAEGGLGRDWALGWGSLGH